MTPSLQSSLLFPELADDLAVAIDGGLHRVLAELDDDPWDLPLSDRQKIAEASRHLQQEWLPRIAARVEPPAPTEDFPAFLLEFPRFRELKHAILEHTADGGSLPTGVADELQRFVDLYRDWLSTPAIVGD